MDRRPDDVPTGKPGIVRLRTERGIPPRIHARAEHDQRRVAEPNDGLGGHLQSALPPELPQEDDDLALPWQLGRLPDEVRTLDRRRPPWLAVEQDGRPLAERPEAVAMIGEYVVDGHDRIDTADPARLLATVPLQDRGRHVGVVVRVEDRIDDVVDHEASPAGALRRSGQIECDRQGQDAEGVVEGGRRELAPERSPPRPDVEGPERDLERLVEVERQGPEESGR